MNRQRPYDFITEKLDQLTGSDNNALWEEMRQVLDEKMPEKKLRKRRFLAWIFRSHFAVIGLSVAIGFSVCFFYNGLKKRSAITQNISMPINKANSKTIAPSTTSNTSDKEHTLNNEYNLNTDLLPSNSTQKEEHKVVSVSTISEQKNASALTTENNSPVIYNTVDGNIALGSENKTILKAKQFKVSKESQSGDSINIQQALINKLNNKSSSLKQKDSLATNATNKSNQFKSSSTLLTSDSGTIKDSFQNRSIEQLPALLTISSYKYKGLDSAFRNYLVSPINPIRDNLRTKGLVIGAAMNFNLPVSRQEMSTVNAQGKRNVLFDYLPSLYIQYHFSEKLYIQSQFQYSNPQYTPNLTLFSRTTDLAPDKRQQDAVSLNKLYYLNLPVSVHYSPVKNFYIGIGTQYSYLQRSILTGDQSIWENGPNGWTKTQETKSIYVKSNPQHEIKKDHINNGNGNGNSNGNGGNGNGNSGNGNGGGNNGNGNGNGNNGNGNGGGNNGNGNGNGNNGGNGNGGGNNGGNGNTGGNANNPGTTTPTLTAVDTVATSFRSSDWRFLMDLSYQWHHFNLGFNFNIGLDNYINAQIGTNNKPIKDRNESFQLYIRYNLFDWRKRPHYNKIIPSKQ